MFDTGQEISTKPSAWSTFVNTRHRLEPLREWKSCTKFRVLHGLMRFKETDL